MLSDIQNKRKKNPDCSQIKFVLIIHKCLQERILTTKSCCYLLLRRIHLQQFFFYEIG